MRQLYICRHEILNVFPSEDKSEWLVSESYTDDFSRKILSTTVTDSFEQSYEHSYGRSLNDAEFESNGPQWRYVSFSDYNSIMTIHKALDLSTFVISIYD